MLVGRLGRLSKRSARQRAEELLALFDLTAAADRLLRTYSGGMRRRLDLAASLTVSPAVLFLDEPTTGLDPRSRLQMWDIIGELRRQGTTIVLTTQYMDEADQLADRISVIDGGRIIAEGTADELKQRVGGDVVHLALHDRSETARAAAALARAFAVARKQLVVDEDLGTVQVPVAAGGAALVEAVRALDAEAIVADDLGLRRPSLDDVFLSLTGHLAEDERAEGPPPRAARVPFRA